MFLCASKFQRPQIFLILLILILCLVNENTEAVRDRGGRCEKPDYIPNGSFRLRRERVLRITCNAGYQLQGSKTIECVRGKWEGEKPVCAKKGCQIRLKPPENGRIQIENELKAILYCYDNYNSAGNRHSYCNGTHWDRPIGTCREHKNVVQHACDFETDDICGWTYELREGLEWKRVMAANVFTTFKTGPRHDHTTLAANGGHYMLMESLTRSNDDVTLTSPIYDHDLTLKTACCFQFYYFMYGSGVGDLFVIVKPVSLSLDNVFKNRKELIKFQKYGNQNNIWNEAHFNIEELKEDFQILFVAKSGHGQLSDIAVDDVKLLTGDDCRALDKTDEGDVEEYDSTTFESLYEMQSCVGRCFDSSGSGIVRASGHLKGLCNCDTDCEDNEICCPDFRAICLSELFSQSTVSSMADETTQIYAAQITNDSTTQSITTSTTTKTTPKSTTIKTTLKTTTTIPKSTTTKTIPLTKTTITITPTTIKASWTVIKTTPAIIKTTSTTAKIKPTSIKTTTLATPSTTSAKTTQTTPKITKTTTTHKTTTARITTPLTTTTTTRRPTTTATTTTRKITPTTPATTTTQKRTTQMKTTITTTKIKPNITTMVQNFTVATSTLKPIPASKPIDYILTDTPKSEAGHKGSSLLLCVFVLIAIIILTGAIYRRFGDRAVAWYMIRFKQNNRGDEDSSSITTSFKRSQGNSNDIEKNSTINWRNKTKKSTNRKNSMKTPLVNVDDDDDEDSIASNGNIALKNNIYTEL